MESKQRKLTIAISETLSEEGAQGLKENLDDTELRVVALYSTEQQFQSQNFEKRKVDYYLLDDLTLALKDIDKLYLPAVLPRPQIGLVQAKTEDLLLLLQDNFLKAKSLNHVQEVISPKSSLTLGEIPKSREKDVLSLQRFPPVEQGIEWLAQEYMRWLARFLFPFLKVTQDEGVVFFSLFFRKLKLLILKHSQDKSSSQRQVYAIEGGLLSLRNTRGQLEFRMTQDKKAILTMIYHYKPRLPWPLYRMSQAIIHVFVMNAFGRYLEKVKRNESK